MTQAVLTRRCLAATYGMSPVLSRVGAVACSAPARMCRAGYRNLQHGPLAQQAELAMTLEPITAKSCRALLDVMLGRTTRPSTACLHHDLGWTPPIVDISIRPKMAAASLTDATCRGSCYFSHNRSPRMKRPSSTMNDVLSTCADSDVAAKRATSSIVQPPVYPALVALARALARQAAAERLCTSNAVRPVDLKASDRSSSSPAVG